MSRPYVYGVSQKIRALHGMLLQVMPGGEAAFSDIARTASRHEITSRQVTLLGARLDMVHCQFAFGKRFAAIHATIPVTAEEGRPPAF